MKLNKAVFLCQILISAMAFVVLWNIPAQATLKKDQRVYSSLPRVQTTQGLAEKFPLQIEADKVLIAKGPVEEEYHPEPGESEESIRQKSEALKAEKEKRKGQQSPLVMPPNEGAEAPPAGSSTNEPPSPNFQELTPENQAETSRPLVIP